METESQPKIERVPLMNCAIADNWSLQIVGELLSKGVDSGEASLLEMERDARTHRIGSAPAGAIAIEALFDLIADVVLREHVWVEARFLDAWQGRSDSLDSLVGEGVIVPFNFLGQPHELDEPREFFVAKLCVSDGLKQAQAENERGWAESKETPHRFLSQVIWGGAGMLARAHVYRHAYTPHPVRRRAMMGAKVVWTGDAASDVRELISEKQMSMGYSSGISNRVTRLQINGMEIAALAIRESSTPEDLFKVALQLRSEYAELRNWLTEYQTAIQSGNMNSMRRFENILRSASLFIDSRLGKSKATGPTFKLGLGFMDMSKQGNPIEQVLNRVGVRSQINRLAFSGASVQDLEALLQLFGSRNKKVGLQIRNHFASA